jgi:release factor glutamine methyltransferase
VARLRTAGCVFAEAEADLLIAAARDTHHLEDLVTQRTDGLPLEHVVGWAEFDGRRIEVDCGVFVPRQRTEFLVEHARALTPAGAVVLDACCGSGAVGVSLLADAAPAALYAIDVEPIAVRCAHRNLTPLGGVVLEGDLYDPLPDELRGRIDTIVANAPYVPTAEIALLPREARIHEPRITLDGGRDGLDIQRRIADGARDWLAPHGHLLLETSLAQAPRSLELCVRAGLTAHVGHDPELDATVVIARADP